MFLQDIPFKWLNYPWFHPKRPMFFNVATLFTDVVECVSKSLKTFLAEVRKTTFTVLSKVQTFKFLQQFNIENSSLGLENINDISYHFYKKWLTGGNEELILGAHRLTSLQLFWMSIARKFYVKFQTNVPQSFDSVGQLQNEYFHVFFKSNHGFQEAFNCNMTKFEAESFEEYQKKFKDLTNLDFDVIFEEF